MLIDGNLIEVTKIETEEARRQLGLGNDFNLTQATQHLYHDPGDGLVLIPLPADMFVVALEGETGERKFGVVRINSLKHKLKEY
ncbi:hypothetical protein [Pseudomonas sp. COR18]|uniref:hypothetical protein n=1 Tax=Pseudomonas sp. COR18 TaxID=3399680 RepID=UPI003B00942B